MKTEDEEGRATIATTPSPEPHDHQAFIITSGDAPVSPAPPTSTSSITPSTTPLPADEEHKEHSKMKRVLRLFKTPEWKILYFSFVFALWNLACVTVWNYATTLLNPSDDETTITTSSSSSTSATTTTTTTSSGGANWGFYALAIHAASVLMFSFVSVMCMEKLGITLSVILSFVCQSIFAGACFTTNTYAVLFTAPLFGISYCLITNAQSTYCSWLAPKNKVGRLMGLVWSVASIGGVVANLGVSLLVGPIGLRYIFLITIGILVVPGIMALFLSRMPPPPPNPDARGVLGKLKLEGKRTISMIKLFKTPGMIALFPGMVIYGTTASFYSSIINPIMGAHKAGIAWTVAMVVKVFTPQISGILADLIPRPVMAVATGLSFLGANLCAWFITKDVALWIPIIMAVLVSLAEPCLWAGFLSPALTNDFGDVEAAYAASRISWPLGSIACMLIGPNVSLHAFDIGHSVWSALVLVSFLFYCWYAWKFPLDKSKKQMKANKVSDMPEIQPSSVVKVEQASDSESSSLPQPPSHAPAIEMTASAQ